MTFASTTAWRRLWTPNFRYILTVCCLTVSGEIPRPHTAISMFVSRWCSSITTSIFAKCKHIAYVACWARRLSPRQLCGAGRSCCLRRAGTGPAPTTCAAGTRAGAGSRGVRRAVMLWCLPYRPGRTYVCRPLRGDRAASYQALACLPVAARRWPPAHGCMRSLCSSKRAEQAVHTGTDCPARRPVLQRRRRLVPASAGSRGRSI